MVSKLITAAVLAVASLSSNVAAFPSPAKLFAPRASDSNLRCPGKELETYPIPVGMKNMTTFSIAVQPTHGRPEPVHSYLATLNEVNTTTGSGITHDTSVAYFDFCGSVKVSVTYTKGRIHTASIRPYSYNIVPNVKGSTLTFTLNQPRNLMIQVNDDIFDALHLLTNPIETNVPNPQDPNVWYFGPGINNGTAYSNVVNNVLSVPDGKTVYVAGGGVLTAQVRFANMTNGAIRGRGVLYNNPGGAILVESATNVLVKDIIVLDPNGYAVTAGEAKGLTIQGMRGFSSKGNGDGIDFFCSQDILVDGVFMRNSDDTIAIYQHRNAYYGDSRNITIQNSALWADVAHPINIGTHGNTDNPETMDGVVIKNIDIMDHREPQMWYQGCIAINAGDSNLIQNVYIEDVRVENFRLGQLVNFRIMYNTKYNTSPGRGIRNVYIKDLTYSGTNANPSLLLGYDADHTISNVTFENLSINGQFIYDTMRKPTWYYTADFVPMFANEHVLNLTFTISP
ncbi:endo-polygalacturonase [Xylogone sp. PMI_703]|nr:endo-polygalacturonase [Xylogone sp. PMI_703]